MVCDLAHQAKSQRIAIQVFEPMVIEVFKNLVCIEIHKAGLQKLSSVSLVECLYLEKGWSGFADSFQVDRGSFLPVSYPAGEDEVDGTNIV
ncbi:hypothetical protein DD235_09515 [Corticimicrobacter populi]|uniref:Uncharacterized protein n=1 Tax=Corticimicrobacter populi TaxID=2175229 RepID=A0A2V1JZM6_9BURK|nr:hypothetical protein DD235_09515 [Corticimicrobacter populi]